MTSPTAYILMTAMPPTKGHIKLIEFAALRADRVEVIVCTQPDEPFCDERVVSISEAIRRRHFEDRIHVNRIHKTIPQEPEGQESFWDMWIDFLNMFGFKPGDYIVASEAYGKTLAEKCGGEFIPYDVDRLLYPGKATNVRKQPLLYFDWIAPEFQPALRKTITVFGAESTGKTTLSRRLADRLKSQWVYEYARPYLESTSIEITNRQMENIWFGQKAVQEQALAYAEDCPFIVQDTDLFSTVGYWDFSEWSTFDQFNKGAPDALIHDAMAAKSDLYIITPSNIPFEHDQLRYGGDHREIQDRVWIDMCKMYGLNYVVLEDSDFILRLEKSETLCKNLFREQNKLINYTRRGSEYAAST